MADSLSDETLSFFEDPYPELAQLRQRPVLWDEQFGFWRITRFVDVDAILKDKRFAKNAPPGTEQMSPVRQNDRFSKGILNLDPPDHTRIRALMTKAFNAKSMNAMRPSIEALVQNLIEESRARGSMELKSEFAHPIPATVISDMLGIPENDRAYFATLSQDIIRFGNDLLAADDDAADAAVGQFDSYMTRLIQEKRRAPTNDLTSGLIQAQDDSGVLSDEELLHNVRLLFIAGHETTVNLICNAVIALFNYPGQLEFLRRNPDRMPAAVEEFLRFDSSVQQLPRIAQEDVDLHGEHIRAGQMVVLMLGAANHDPAMYENSEVLDVERAFFRSKSLGGGAHFCLGAQLARIETEIAIRRLITDLPGLTVSNLDELTYPPNPFFRGPDRVQVSWG